MWLVLVRKMPVFVNFRFLSMISQLIKKKKKKQTMTKDFSPKKLKYTITEHLYSITTIPISI